MHHDVYELRKFYYTRALGRVVQKVLRDRLTAIWPPEQLQGMTVAGYGFAAPLLRPYLARVRRVTALMPGPQGVMAWPAGMPNCSVLCEETAWPLDTGSVDRLVLLHALETADHPAALMEEALRVLGPGGRMLVMVPNRAGLWAQLYRQPA
jgi:SAM-dependent methyltransferase